MLGQVNFNDLFHFIKKERIIWFRKKFQKDIVNFHSEFCNWIILHDKGFNDVKIFQRNFVDVIFTFSLNQSGDDVIHLFLVSLLVSSSTFISDVRSRACWFVLAWNKKTGISFVLLWFYDVRQREEIYQKSIAQFKQKNTFYLVYNTSVELMFTIMNELSPRNTKPPLQRENSWYSPFQNTMQSRAKFLETCLRCFSNYKLTRLSGIIFYSCLLHFR